MSKLVGLVGWRGMVGSVLMDRMQTEGDFDLIDEEYLGNVKFMLKVKFELETK